MGARLDLKVKADPGSELRKLGLEEPGVAELGVPVGLLFFVVVPLSCTMAPLLSAIVSLEAESSSSSLGVAKPRESFLYQVAILKQSKAETKKF